MNALSKAALKAAQDASHARQLICSTAIDQMRNFLFYGLPLDPFATALITQRESEAYALAPGALLEEDAIIPGLLEWVERHVPNNFFDSPEAIQRWYTHHGLSQAGENDRMWFYLKNNVWSPRKLARLQNKRPGSALSA